MGSLQIQKYIHYFNTRVQIDKKKKKKVNFFNTMNFLKPGRRLLLEFKIDSLKFEFLLNVDHDSYHSANVAP